MQLRKHCISKAEQHRARRSEFFGFVWFENIVFERLVYFGMATIRRRVAVDTPTAQVKLENVGIANALQLEAAPRRSVPLRFNFVARAKFEVAQPIRCHLKSVFTAYTLRYAVTLNFDPVTLTLSLIHI